MEFVHLLLGISRQSVVFDMGERPVTRQSLQQRMLKRIDRKRGNVFLREDFKDLGGYDQVGRTLRILVRHGRLPKVGHGLYTRAVKSPIDDTLMPPKGLTTLKEALRRLGVEIAQTRLEQDHSAGRTTQVPRPAGTWR